MSPDASAGLRARVTGWITDAPLGAAGYAALIAAGVAIRVGFVAAAGLTGPVGEDLEFWAYRALEIGLGRPFGTHPPLYPAAIAALHGLGAPRLGAGVGLAALAGIAIAPAMAWLGAQVAGGRGARIAGGLALTWPAITAWSVRLEPTAPFLVGLALVLGAAAIAARDHRTAPAAIAGFGTFGLVLTKESGLVAFAAVLAALAFSGPGRGRRVGAAMVAFGVPLALWMGAEALATHGGVAGKASLPIRDTLLFLSRGDIPPPMRNLDDPWGLISPAFTARHAQGGPAVRLALYGAVEASRWLRQLGLWGPIAVVVSIGAVREARAGRLPAWAVALGLGAELPLAMSAVLLVQGRHAETGLVGTALLIGLIAATPERRARAADAMAALAVQGALFLGIPELLRMSDLIDRAADVPEVAAWVEAAVPAGSPLCATSYRLGVALDRPLRDCWNRQDLPSGPFYVVVNDLAELSELRADLRPIRDVAKAVDRVGTTWLLLHTRDPAEGRPTEVRFGPSAAAAPATPARPGARPERPRYRDFRPR